MRTKYLVACFMDSGRLIRVEASSLKGARALCASIHESYKPTIIEHHQKITPNLLRRLQVPKIELKMIATYKAEQVGLIKSVINLIMFRKPKRAWSVTTEKEAKAS